ncbi:UDP-N-acetylenolpyruvoylglucosamine reductase [Alcanivorax xiamenensis]|uniref:UDP-N-acetylenolpyruvoylglucosamine reductase n=1 Tax=Alcanivorax xiamenensis TaxID=1177156 RepID=A0ABQ6YAQ4_9GAMM|nr:UDP-N-acetylmuramate dehydrogenase [Alcanivorax xiamenensis]KAF0806941.1 UDP-N-acetylenolpyruvoylglucosamine reductase [Alcanivorax xiamenensis]
MIETDVDLSTANTLALPARAERLACPSDVDELARVLTGRGTDPLFVLGGGSNLVLTGDLPGLTVMPAFDEVSYRQVDEGQARVRVGAGVVWDRLVADTVAAGWQGLENLSLIPGSVGAAPFQNIGAYGVELADVVSTVEAVSVEDGSNIRFDADQCEFAYRDSLFKSRCRGEFIITHLTLNLRRGSDCPSDSFRLDYGGLAERLEGDGPVTPARVREAVIALRRSKLPDPADLPNAGSFFKNPVVSLAHYQRLLESYPELVSFPVPEGRKLAAGWLIERSGWKGRRLGPVGMHDQQALVLVNHGGATAVDVLTLAAAVREDVRQRFGVELEQEPVLMPGALAI